MNWQDYVDTVLISKQDLQQRIAELGAQISRDYEGKDLLLVCVLKGGVMFLTDLMRRVTIPHQVDFMAVSSYGTGVRQSSGIVRIMMDLGADIKDRNVLIVEDILDSGLTLKWLLRNLASRGPATLEVCTLLRKPDAVKVDIHPKYVGFDIPNEFVVGYGLDYDGQFRNLRGVGTLARHVYNS